MNNTLTARLIKSAVLGNSISIIKIVEIYQPYINTLASKKLYDDDGCEYIGINVDLQEQLTRKLINLIIKFKVV